MNDKQLLRIADWLEDGTALIDQLRRELNAADDERIAYQQRLGRLRAVRDTL